MDRGSPAPARLGPRTRLRRVEGIAWRLIEEEAVLVNVRRDEVMHLNAVASFLWTNLDGEASLADIAQSMTEEYEVDADTALTDTVAFAADLVEQGAAEVVELE